MLPISRSSLSRGRPESGDARRTHPDLAFATADGAGDGFAQLVERQPGFRKARDTRVADLTGGDRPVTTTRAVELPLAVWALLPDRHGGFEVSPQHRIPFGESRS